MSIPTKTSALSAAITSLESQINSSLNSVLSAQVNVSFLPATSSNSSVSSLQTIISAYTAKGWSCSIQVLPQPWTGSGVGTPTTTILTIQ